MAISQMHIKILFHMEMWHAITDDLCTVHCNRVLWPFNRTTVCPMIVLQVCACFCSALLNHLADTWTEKSTRAIDSKVLQETLNRFIAVTETFNKAKPGRDACLTACQVRQPNNQMHWVGGFRSSSIDENAGLRIWCRCISVFSFPTC